MLISVNGEHSTETLPDIGTLTITFENENKDSAEAKRLTNQAVREFIAVLEQWRAEDPAPIEEPVIEPLHTYVYTPKDAWGKKSSMTRASAVVRLEFTSMERLNWATQEWAGRKEVQVSQVWWQLSRDLREQLERDSLKHALDSALDRARAIADAAGATNVRILEIADPGMMESRSSNYGARMYAMAAPMAAMGGDEDPGFEAKPDTITVSVRLDVRIEADLATT